MGIVLNPKNLIFAQVVIGGGLVLIGAIIIERALNDLVLDNLPSLVVMGIGLIITGIGLCAVVLRKIPTIPLFIVIVTGIGCIIIGIALSQEPETSGNIIYNFSWLI